MQLRVGDLLVATHLPFAHRRDDLDLGGERRHRRLDADLVVALARAAVGDRVGVERTRGLDGELGQQRASETRERRVAALVARVGEDRRADVLTGELVLGVDQDRLERAEVACLLEDRFEVVGGLAEIDAQRDDLRAVFVLDPLEHHRRVEAAGVQQHDAMDVLGTGDIRSGELWCNLCVRHKRPHTLTTAGQAQV